MAHGKHSKKAVLTACLFAVLLTGLLSAPSVGSASVAATSGVSVRLPDKELPEDPESSVLLSPDSEHDFSTPAEPQRLFALSKAARDYLDQHDVIYIAIPAASPPLSYFDRQRPNGIYVAFLNALNKRLGNKLQAIPLATPPRQAHPGLL